MAAKRKRRSEEKAQNAVHTKRTVETKSAKRTKSLDASAKEIGRTRPGSGEDNYSLEQLTPNTTKGSQAEEALRKSEAQLRTIIESLDEGLVVADLAGNPFHWNPAAVAMHGFGSVEECRRKLPEFAEIFELSTEEDGILPLERWPLARILRGDTLRDWEVHVRRLDSDWRRIFSYGGTLARDQQGKPLLAIVTLTDITQRKKAEQTLWQSREDLDRAQAVGNIGSWRLDVRKDMLTWSDENHRIFGIPKGAPMTYETFLSTVHPEDRRYVDAKWKAGLAGEPYDIEHRIVVDGQVKWVREKAYLEFDDKGILLGGFGITQDITHRKRAEEQIASIAKFPAENPNPVLRLERDGTILYSNDAGSVFLEKWNSKAGEAVPAEWKQIIKEALRTNTERVQDIECGRRIYLAAAVPVPEGGYVNLYGRDVTEERQAQRALQQAHDELETRVKERTAELAQTVAVLHKEVEERVSAEKKLKERTRDLDAFFSNTIAPLVILDRKFNFLRVNKAFADACQRDISQFEGHDYFEFYPHEENERIFRRVVRTKQPYVAVAKPFSFPDHPEWGVTYWDWTLVPILDEAGKVDILLYSLEDVTKRQRAELELQQSEEKYRSLVEFSPEAVYVVVAEKVAFANTAALKLTGAHTGIDLIGRSMWDFISQDSAEAIRADIRELLEEGRSVSLREAGIIRLDGSKVQIEASATSVVHQGKPAILAIFRDITERKRAEEAALAERQRFYDVLETLPAYVCLLKPDYLVSFANRVFRETFGYVPEKKCYEFLFNRTEPCEICETYSVLKTSKPHRWEWNGPNGRDYDIFDFPFTDSDGSQLIMEMGIDITERKRAERRLRTTNALLALFARKVTKKEYLDSAVEIIRSWSGCRCVGIRLTNADGYIPYESCVGFSEEFLSVEGNLSLREDVCACIRVVAQMPEPQDARVMTKRGSFCCDDTFGFVASLSESERRRFRGNCLKAGLASVAVVPVRYRKDVIGAIHVADEAQNKVPLEAVEFIEDMAAMIGEAVQRFDVEESLRLSKDRLLEAQRLAHLGNWEWDIVKNKLWWSDEVYRIFGVKPQQFGATYDAFLSYVHPDDRTYVVESVNKALYEAQRYDIDHRVIRLDGSERTVNESAEVACDSSGKPLKMVGTVHDITEQKRAEREIRENQRELRALAAELERAEEEERRRIAQDLHDSIGQILAFSRRELAGLEKSAPEKLAASIKEVGGQLDKAVREARTLSFELSPSVLYDLGLAPALEDLAERFSDERRIECLFRSSGEAEPADNAVKILLYRSVRELLVNIAKHANASQVSISLQRIDDEVRIEVKDDGTGFDASVLKSGRGKPKGFGLLSMRERLSHIGGRFEVEAAKGRGTRVTLAAPLAIKETEPKG